MNVAFLGLGNMGSGMAHCLLRAGHPIRVWNRSPDKMAALERAGAVACPSPASTVQDAHLVISSLIGPSPHDRTSAAAAVRTWQTVNSGLMVRTILAPADKEGG